MQYVPAYCPSCGHVFLAPNLITGAVGTQVQIENVETWCERCHQLAIIPDGHYQMSQSGLQLINGPQLSRLIVDRLSKIATNARQKAKKGNITADEILAEIAGVSPELAEKLKTKHSKSVMFLVLFLFWLIGSFNLNASVDLNKLIDQVTEQCQNYPAEKLLKKSPKHLSPPTPLRQDQHTFGIVAAPKRGNRKARREAASRARRKS